MNSESLLFDYQSDLAIYVKGMKNLFDDMSSSVETYCGGYEAKTVLEIGCGFHLPHGGINLSLALQRGAKQCFGIDIVNPEVYSADKRKVDFWKHAAENYNIFCNGLNQNRVYFSKSDIIYNDIHYPRIVTMQMSASSMYFRDNMFDLVISNAVLEHVKNTSNVLKELFRVLKPGGSSFMTWNPFSGLEMGGHDIGMPFYYPWAHLRLAEASHVEKMLEVFSDEKIYKNAFPPEHTVTEERARAYVDNPKKFYSEIMDDLNKLRVHELLKLLEEAGFEIINSSFYVKEGIQKFLTPEIRRELSDFSEEELLCLCHKIAFRKPSEEKLNTINY